MKEQPAAVEAVGGGGKKAGQSGAAPSVSPASAAGAVAEGSELAARLAASEAKLNKCCEVWLRSLSVLLFFMIHFFDRL
jgi:hypothetical protein